MKIIKRIKFSISIFLVKLVLKKVIKKILKKMKREGNVKKGKNSTEFWLTVTFNLIATALMVVGQINPDLYLKICAVLNGVYTVGRTLVKMTSTDIDDKVIEKIKELSNK